jgi:hypothetical protein
VTQPLSLSSEKMVSMFAFSKCNLCRSLRIGSDLLYFSNQQEPLLAAIAVGLCTLNQVDP